MGQTVHDEWERTAEIRPNTLLDAFQVIPNHIHGIVMIEQYADPGGSVGAHSCAPFSCQPRSLSSPAAGFKSASTKRINQLRQTPGMPVWQRNYYERVVRDERELRKIRQYIVNNPAKWAEDSDNPENRRPV